MTMGTSIMRASFSLTFTLLPGKSGILGGLEALRLSGLTVQEIEGLFVADPISDSIQRSITCQTSADRLRSLICLLRQCFNLAINFIIADFNFLLIGDLIEQQRTLYFLQSLVTLPGAQPLGIHFLHVFRLHALGGESTKAAVETNVNLPVN